MDSHEVLNAMMCFDSNFSNFEFSIAINIEWTEKFTESVLGTSRSILIEIDLI